MTNTTYIKRSRNSSSRLALIAAVAAPMLGACAADRVVQSPTIPSDYRARHPIALTEAPVTTDIIPVGGRLDTRAREQVRAFAAEYRSAGGGPIAIQVPVTGRATHAHAIVEEIRREMAGSGVRGGVTVSSYQPADPRLISPIRLSYLGTKAVVRSRCGEWPADLASGSTVQGWENQPYWNLGCSYQQMLASQVADPRDLAGPRAEAQADVTMRTRAIGKVREGADPGTDWKIENTSIGTAGAN
jgi:pilus assembly protein CpaD